MASTRLLALCGLALLCGSATAEQVNPMDKVFQLMDELTAKITKEGEAEDKAFKEFFEWCDDAATTSHQTIETGTKKKAQLEATINKATADGQAATTSIEELAAAIATAEADLKAATAIRTTEAADFATVEGELVDGIDTLGRAIGVLEKEMGSAAFVQTVDSSNIQALLMTLNVVISKAGIQTADKSKLVALVQNRYGDEDSDMDSELGAPAAANYNSQSGGIVGVLGDMKDKAEGELKDARSAESKSKHAFGMLKQGLTDQLAADNKELSSQKAVQADASETKATGEGDLAETNEELKNANNNLATVSGDCMTSASDHEASSKARAEELGVIAQAKQIVKDATAGATERQYSFVQVKEESRMQLANTEVVAAVRKLARQQKSAALAQLASRIAAVARYGGGSADDIFAKVKGLINEMIAKLQKEAAEEATKKAYCDEEMAKTKSKKDELTADVEKLTAKIDKAAAASAGLKEDTKTLQAELAALAKLTQEMNTARTDEKAAFDAAKTDLVAGINGVQKALEVLRNYYGSASFMQEKNFDAFMQQPSPPAGHSASSGAGGSIISILEVCESDFSKSLAQEEATESDAQAEYDKVTQENKITTATKEQDVKYKTKEAKGLDKAIAEFTGDRSGLQTELDAVLEYQEKINDQCIAKPESYEDRKAAREAEINGLKEALDILSSEGVFLQKSRNLRRVAMH